MSSLYRRFNELNYLSIVETLKVLNGVYRNPLPMYTNDTNKRAQRFKNRMVLISEKHNVYVDKVSKLMYAYAQPCDNKLTLLQIQWYRVEEKDTGNGKCYNVRSSTDHKALPDDLFNYINFISGYQPRTVQLLLDMVNVVAPIGGTSGKLKTVSEHYLNKYGCNYMFVLNSIKASEIIHSLDTIKLYYECTQHIVSGIIATCKDYYYYEHLGIYVYFEYDLYLDDGSVNYKRWHYHGKQLQRTDA